MNTEIRDLTSDIDYLDNNICTPYDWDVVIMANYFIEYKIIDADIELENLIGNQIGNEELIYNDYPTPMRVYRVHDYFHSIGDKGYDLYICKRDEKPSEKTLVPFDDSEWSIWGIKITPGVFYSKHGVRCNVMTEITRNGEVFDIVPGKTIEYTLVEAQHMINKLKEPDTPFYFWEIDFEKRIVGTKCHWKGRPCTITRYIKGQNCVMLDIIAGDDEYDSGEEIKDHILSPSFDWWKNEKVQ